MNFMEILKQQKYIDALDYATNNFENLNKKDIKLLKRMILFCASDFISTYKNEMYENNDNNPFFLKSKKLELIKALFDSEKDIFLYVYNNINEEVYIENELKKYRDIFPDIVFIKRNLYNKRNNLYKNGIIVKESFFKEKEIEQIKKIALEHILNNELSEFYFNESRQRVVLNGDKDSAIISVFKNLINYEEIENLFFEQTNIRTVSNYIQLELMKKTPVQTDGIKTWHIDNLSDQFKVFIPLVDITENNAPMNYIPTTHNYKNLHSKVLNYVHYSYKFSGVHTTNANNFPNDIVEKINKKQKKATLKKGDIALFNTALFHTGSRVKDENEYRLNIVLIFNQMNTNRNIIFKQLKPFY